MLSPYASFSFRVLFTLAIAVATLGVLELPLSAAPKPGYKAYIAGNAADVPQSPNLTPGLALMGGGTDVDAAFQWMCQRAGGGDFVVIRTTGTDAYNPYIQQLCPQMDSVETIIITTVAGRKLIVCQQPHPKRRGPLDRRWRPVNLHEPLARNCRAVRRKFSAQFQGRAGWRDERRPRGAQSIHLHGSGRLGDLEPGAG